MTKRIFGHVPGVAVGTSFASYAELNGAGVHKQTQAGISGSGTEGAESVVVSGGYPDDQDSGDEIIYTGQGGRDTSGKHVKDQELVRGNLALAKSELEGLPVRIIRGAHPGNPYAPKTAYRYDGLYRVESHWHEKGKAGFKVWRYRLQKIDDNDDRTVIATTTSLEGGNSTPGRVTSTTQRVVRDTKQAKALKLHYAHTCQVCSTQIVTASGPYAEAAHIRPLGTPHNGPDTVDNILCLCPNHHVMFDLGAFAIADDLSLIGIDGKLSLRDGHTLDPEHIRYHRDHYLDLLLRVSN